MQNRYLPRTPNLGDGMGGSFTNGSLLSLVSFCILTFVTLFPPIVQAAAPNKPPTAVKGLQTGNLYALAVGVSSYRDPKIPRLDLADKDAQAFGEFLQNQKKVFKDIHVKLLLNEKATKAEVEKYLYYTLRKTGKNDTIILYFSGHGAYDSFRPEEKDFLFLTHDSEAEYLATTAVKMNGLDFLKGIEAERVLIIADACYAGGFSNMKSKSPAPSLKLFLDEVRSSSGRAVITSGTEGQLSWEIPGRKNSVFTQALIEGLKGKADLDRDGVVTLNEAYQYAYAMTKDQTAGRQHPQLEGKVVGVFPLSYVGPGILPDELKRQILLNAATGDVAEMENLLRSSADPNTRNDDNDTPLIIASRNGRLDVVKLLLLNGADADARNQTRDTALTAAAEQGHTEVVKQLLDAGANINSRNMEDYTPIAAACRAGKTETVKLLLSRGADLKSRTVHGRTALILAASRGHTEVVKLLLDSNAEVSTRALNGETAWTAAAVNGHAAIVDMLKSKGAEISAADGTFLDSQLILAVLNDDIGRAKEVLGLGANADARAHSGDSALALASGLGRFKLMGLLLDAGANVDLPNHKENTPLLNAAANGRVKSAQILLDGGAAINAVDKEKNSSLVLAARNGHVEMVKLLLKKPVHIDARTRGGRTALIHAAENGHLETVRALLTAGADIKAVNKNRDTALHAAARGGHADVVKLLCEKRADITARNNQGSTALMPAAKNGHKAVVKQLLNRGADIDAKDWEGKTAGIIALESDRKDLAEMLPVRSQEPGATP